MPLKTGPRWIRWIAFFKLFKALILLAVMAMSFDLIRHDPTQVITRWALTLHVDLENRYLNTVLAWLLRVDVKYLELFAVGTGLYTLLFAVEGVGLWLKKTWAEYLTIISTAGFLPVEGYELVQHVSLAKCIVLLLNAAILIYLVDHARQKIAVRRFPTSHSK